MWNCTACGLRLLSCIPSLEYFYNLDNVLHTLVLISECKFIVFHRFLASLERYNQKPVDDINIIRKPDLENHNKDGGLWVVIQGKVYDIHDYREQHMEPQNVLQYTGIHEGWVQDMWCRLRCWCRERWSHYVFNSCFLFQSVEESLHLR